LEKGEIQLEQGVFQLEKGEIQLEKEEAQLETGFSANQVQPAAYCILFIFKA
jgi:hypothetical protein